MQIKSPKDPIILSEEAFESLESMLKRNEKRTRLNQKEKKLLEDSKKYDADIRRFINE